MIASLRGTLLVQGPDYIVIEAGGVGYHVAVPRPVIERLGSAGDEVRVLTHMIVREDAMLLFGFSDVAERAFFELLLSVTGVGPKVALALLGAAPVDQLQLAIANENMALLAQVPGIGKKTAARLILELKAKVGQLPSMPAITTTGSPFGRVNMEVQEVLQSLGYSAVEAQAAVSSLPVDAPADIEERLREALRYFGGA
ncbi:MAG: Holliday junction branch migration protein RuvA [Herpetosiphonaceae bacterium]|nr:Holliday junction branch migration protein RuvA [Herpetosiphonaceae bacterium]